MDLLNTDKELNFINDNDNDIKTINKCVICGIDMGIDNPRQLCKKWYCDMEDSCDDNDGPPKKKKKLEKK